jgi:hypothetical protein
MHNQSHTRGNLFVPKNPFRHFYLAALSHLFFANAIYHELAAQTFTNSAKNSLLLRFVNFFVLLNI